MNSRTAKLALTLVGGAAATEPLSYGACAPRSGDTPAYLVAEVEVTDPAAFEAYVEKAMESLKPYNARVISNSRPDVKEGAPAQSHVIILAFDSMADAQKWYGSSPSKELIPERQKAARTRLYLIEGTPS